MNEKRYEEIKDIIIAISKEFHHENDFGMLFLSVNGKNNISNIICETTKQNIHSMFLSLIEDNPDIAIIMRNCIDKYFQSQN